MDVYRAWAIVAGKNKFSLKIMNNPRDKRRAEEIKSANTETQEQVVRRTNKTSMVIALIAAGASLGGATCNYLLTERVRTDISAQTLNLQKQTLELDRIKVDLARAVQQTAVANSKIEEARLALQTKVADSAAIIESRKLSFSGRNTDTNEARLTPDIAKLLNDLRPSLAINCSMFRPDIEHLRIDCNFKSLSAFKVLVTPGDIFAKDALTGTTIPHWSNSFDGLDSNQVLSGGSGGDSFSTTLLPSAQMLRNVIVFVKFRAVTEPTALAVTKRLAKGYLTQSDLDNSSTQLYTSGVRGDFAL